MPTAEWFKMLEELTFNRNPSLEQRIHDEILVKAQHFTMDKAADFAEGTELMGKIMMAQADYESSAGAFTDMFGDYLTQSNGTWKRLGQVFTPTHIAQFIAEMSLPQEELAAKPAKILDPCCGTGRFMLAAAKHYAEKLGYFNFMFYNVDIDFAVYNYCALNAILHRIPSVTILGDSLRGTGREGVVVIPSAPVEWRMLDEAKADRIMKGMIGVDRNETELVPFQK
jgi:type I restriction-modification system DNA methylase subunit